MKTLGVTPSRFAASADIYRQGSTQLSRKELDDILSNHSQHKKGPIKRSSSMSINKESGFVNDLAKSTKSPDKKDRDEKESFNFSHKSSLKFDTMSEYERLKSELERKRHELHYKIMT